MNQANESAARGNPAAPMNPQALIGMELDAMRVEPAEFVDGIELGGVATFMEEALKSRMTIFL